jgi:hypothetical protein
MSSPVSVDDGETSPPVALLAQAGSRPFAAQQRGGAQHVSAVEVLAHHDGSG